MKYIFHYIAILFFTFTALWSVESGKVLTPEEAFNVNIVSQKDSIQINFVLGEQIYIYDNKIKIELLKPKKIDLSDKIQKPAPSSFHGAQVHTNNFSLQIPYALIQTYTNSPFTIQASWQGCSKKGLCYQPMTKEQSFSANGQEIKTENLSEQDTIAYTLANSNIFWIILSFFGFGLLLSLTPCVFPMIPILSSIIVSQSGEKMDAKKGFFLSLVYVLAMSVAYTIAGVLAGLFGSNLQSTLQNPYVLFTFSGIFVFLAFSMFGFYELQLPQSLQNIANKKSDKMKNKGIIGIAIMGFLSALIVGPCVAAPLAGALIYIGQSGDAFLGGAALFFMSLGMGVPLLIIGASAGKFLPKPGFWMDTIKTIFGVLMLGVAIWMIERVVYPWFSLLLWSLLFIGSAIYAGALEPIKNGNGWKKLLKTFAFVLLLYGVILFVGALSGGKSLYNPLGSFTSTNSSMLMSTSPIDFLHVKNNEELNTYIQNANKPILIDFWATWCVSCKELDEITFRDARVQQEMKKFMLLKVDVTNNTMEDKELLKRFNLFGPPGIVFYKNKKELKNLQLVGFKGPDEFLAHLGKVFNAK